MRLAVLGGSFNPVHIGHLFLAEEACALLGYDRVLFIPACVPAHKELDCGAGNAQRLALLEAALSPFKSFTADACELERGGISYTFDTLTYLLQKYQGSIEGRIGFIMGDDLVAGFDRWKRASDLADIADIVLARRCAGDCEFSYRHISLDNTLFPVSSSDIRRRISSGGAWRSLVGERVASLIELGGLYGYKSD